MNQPPNLKIEWTLSTKQLKAFKILNDKTHTELFYGGAAGGGKSWLGCGWLVLSCIKYPGSRWLMGRAVLKNLKQSTLLTFFEICSKWGLKKDEHYRYNATENVITFWNGSEVYLKDLFMYPSDPEFDSLGSTEYTGAFIDEVSQVNIKAKNIVMSRIRYKLEKFDRVPKLFLASNPSKNFLYYDFYKPWKEKTLLPYRYFIPALVQDNPFISEHYIENLKKLDTVSKERLLYGNFEYDDDPATMIPYENILNMFNITTPHQEQFYLSVDVARHGKDKTVFILWRGLQIKRIWSFAKNTTKEVRLEIEKTWKQYNMKPSNTVIDEDGVGGGVVDELGSVKGFVNNSRPYEKKHITTDKYQEKRWNYRNLKSQCYFFLADYINSGRIGIDNIDIKTKETLVEELEQVKRKDIDKDNKLEIVPKHDIKELLGRSPDYSDAMMMRMYFEVNKRDVVFFMA